VAVTFRSLTADKQPRFLYHLDELTQTFRKNLLTQKWMLGVTKYVPVELQTPKSRKSAHSSNNVCALLSFHLSPCLGWEFDCFRKYSNWRARSDVAECGKKSGSLLYPISAFKN
jgi:hypothetical protein